jgi:Ca-activated chloride channel family protein
MMEHNNNKEKEYDIDLLLQETLSQDEIPPEVHTRLQKRLDSFRIRLNNRQSSEADKKISILARLFTRTRLVLASSMFLVCLLVAWKFIVFPSMISSRHKEVHTEKISKSRMELMERNAVLYSPADTSKKNYYSYDLGYSDSSSFIKEQPPSQAVSWGLYEGYSVMDDFSVKEQDFNTETYDRIVENSFQSCSINPLSTFSIDVDTASYSLVRRFINSGQLPSPDAVRIEEMINYFSYDYPQPEGDAPFSVTTEVASCPWNENRRLLRIGMKGREMEKDRKPPSNLVFLVDVSGSMNASNKLNLVKQGLGILVGEMTEDDHIALVAYAGASGLVLPSTPADNKRNILDALESLQSGGSTNGGEGIMLAYETAAQNFITDGVNRVILCTDGDFNVGVTSRGELTSLIEKEAQTGIYLSILGFGMGNFKDATMEELSNKGNGNYAYIDTINEAKKVLSDQMTGTLFTIAKDVKIQIEFNPLEVEAYRLIGYENRMMRAEDFQDDKKDAGEIGAGHTVTALYEILLKNSGETADLPSVDPLKYQEKSELSQNAFSGELATVKLRYKEPDEEESRLLDFPVKDENAGFENASDDFKFASAVAAYGMILRDSEFKGNATLDMVKNLGEQGVSLDRFGYRSEFLELVEKTRSLKNNE